MVKPQGIVDGVILGDTPREMRPPETRYAKTVDGFHIAYQTIGEGAVDVLGVGAYFSNLEHKWDLPSMAATQRSLSEIGRLILLDGRGTGLSDRLHGDRLPTLEERIDDVRAVLDAVNSRTVVLVSFADAGPLCCLFAATYPERTHALVLCNTRPRTAWAPDYPWGMTPEEFDKDLEASETRWGTRAYAQEIAAQAVPSRADDEDLIDWWAADMRLSASPSAAAQLLRMYHDMDVRHILPAIHVPTLVLASDPVYDESAAMAAAIPGAEIVRIASSEPTVMSSPKLYVEQIRRFVSRIQGEEADLDKVLATVLFTDIVASTQRAAAGGDNAWRELVERHHRFIRGMLARWRGREMDTAGDGFFAAFDGPARAIRCATAITGGIQTLGLEVRAGVHTGECELIDGKMAGLTVAIGARVAARAGPSEVLVSQTVKDLVAGSDIAFEDAGEHELKGVPDRWRLYRVLGPSRAAGAGAA
jgi:class 3 adenylate cyclase